MRMDGGLYSDEVVGSVTQGLSVTQFLKEYGGLILQMPTPIPMMRLDVGGQIYDCPEDPLGLVQFCVENFIRRNYCHGLACVSTISQRLGISFRQMPHRAWHILRAMGDSRTEFRTPEDLVHHAAMLVIDGRNRALQGKNPTFPYAVPDLNFVKHIMDGFIKTRVEIGRDYLSEEAWMEYGPGGRKIDKQDIYDSRKVLGLTTKSYDNHRHLLPFGAYPIGAYLKQFRQNIMGQYAVPLQGGAVDRAILVDALRYRGLLRLFNSGGIMMLEKRALAGSGCI